MDRRAKTTLAVTCLLLAVPLSSLARWASPGDGISALPLALTARADTAAEAAAPPPRPSPRPPLPTRAIEVRADRDLVRSWRAPLAGGLLTFPPSFASEDGR